MYSNFSLPKKQISVSNSLNDNPETILRHFLMHAMFSKQEEFNKSSSCCLIKHILNQKDKSPQQRLMHPQSKTNLVLGS